MKMSRTAQIWAAAGVAAVGLALSGQSHWLAVAVSFLGVLSCFFLHTRLNTLSTRAAYLVAIAMHAAVVFLATGSPWFAGIALVVPATTVFYGSVAAWGVAYVAHFATLVVLIAAAAIVVLTWPGWSGASVLPSLAHGAMFVVAGELVRAKLRRTIEPGWNVREGEMVPELELERPGGGVFRLSRHRGEHVLLMFLVGDWCPVCHVKLRIYRRAAKKLAEHGVRVVAIWASNAPISETMARELDISFDLLSDPSCAAAAMFGVVQRGAPGPTASRPMSFLVGPDGRLLNASDPAELNSFMDPDAALSAVLGAFRTAPELRGAGA